jgi:hypothetical protein
MNRGMFFAKCVLFGLIAISLVGVVTLLLWNWLIPTLFKGPVINYWEALGLLLLTKILFWRVGGGSRNTCNTTDNAAAPYWKHRFYEKFSTMKPEDREAFKNKMKEKWCNWEKKTTEEN